MLFLYVLLVFKVFLVSLVMCSRAAVSPARVCGAFQAFCMLPNSGLMEALYVCALSSLCLFRLCQGAPLRLLHHR